MNNREPDDMEFLVIGIGAILALGMVVWMLQPKVLPIAKTIAETLLWSKNWWLTTLGLDNIVVARKLAGITAIPASSGGYTLAARVLGDAFREYVAIIIPGLLTVGYFLNHSLKLENRFYRKFDYYSLKKEMLKIYPQMKPILNVHPWSTPEEAGAYTRSETYWEWAAKHKIIDPEAETPAESRDSFDIVRCKQAMKAQMGDVFPMDVVDTMNLKPSEKIVMAVYCAFFEGDSDEYKRLIDTSANWWSEERTKKGGETTIKYHFRVPDKEISNAERIIRQALTNSKTINKYDRARYKKQGRPMANRYVMESVMNHDFVQTVLMSMKSKIPLTSANELKWLQSINPNLFYALQSVGSEGFSTRGMTPAIIYGKEAINAKLGEKVIEKEFGRPLPITRDELLDGAYNWANICNHLYAALEKTQWVHHSRYREITPDEEIELLRTAFSFDNQVIAVTPGVLIGESDNKTFKPTSLRFYEVGSLTPITEEMTLNEQGGLGPVDYRRAKALISGNQIIALDPKAFRSIYIKSNPGDTDKPHLSSYSVLRELFETEGFTGGSWGEYMVLLGGKSGKKSKEQPVDATNADHHIMLYNTITQNIAQIYQPE